MSRASRHVLLGIVSIPLIPVAWVLLACATAAVIVWEALRQLGEGFEFAVKAVSTEIKRRFT